MNENGTISFENSKRMMDRAVKVDDKVRDRAWIERNVNHGKMFDDIVKEQYGQLNKMVFDEAQRMGVSVYSVCMHFMPEYGEPRIKHDGDSIVMEQDMRLVPMPLELEHGPGYWKGKYFRLKQKMQELIDNKED